MMPKARDHDLLVEECNRELLVYDLHNDRAHSLNTAAALIWRWSDGNTSVAEITTRLSAELHKPIDTEEVEQALQRLSDANLLEEPALAGVSRRQFVKKAAAAVAGLAIVASIRTPAAACAESDVLHCNAGNGNGSEGCDPGNSSTSPDGSTGQNQGGDEGGPQPGGNTVD